MSWATRCAALGSPFPCSNYKPAYIVCKGKSVDARRYLIYNRGMNQASVNIAPPLIIPPVKLLTTAEVALRLGVHRTRVHALITAGRLPATKYGSVYLIRESDLKLVEDRKPGRPSKSMKKKGAKR